MQPAPDADLPDDIALSVAAAMARQHADDARAFLGRLAALLESALPGEVSVQRAGLFGGDRRPVKRVEVTLPDGDHAARYVLEDAGRGPLAATQTQVVRGIALKSENCAVPDWIAAVGAAIERRAAESAAVRNALRDALR
jgi:hypothetical protein